ncbi:mannose-6-phosphate isomerase, class I [Bailinhaonella thermotolerans]|uniref:mannose-6-phosphate isomerase n=1 Tax=Bailinhaonella thermotolerans TaxID=1070861 RepID=A0A3A4AY28_9ACTN|nr:mannose-6-phosphate isomerase, class I [Bailinhaonella thermotolerans]
MYPLDGTVQPYAWGSRTVIASLQGRPVPSDRPEAELWLGAHPGAPSRVDGRPLDEIVAADPEGVLGPAVAAEFGPRLPYLLKLLAAEEPLSLQAHPDAAHARAAFAAEEAAGPPPEERNYRDPHHKPELLVATDDFEALCGFRDPREAADLLTRLGVPALRPVAALLRGPAAETALREAVTRVLTLPGAARASAVRETTAACAKLADVDPAYEVAARLAVHYPGDAGVIVSLLLNHVRLNPGEAVWMPAGNLHAYLRGTGVEVMASGDNVLRGGLTPKRVDVPELLRVLRFEPLPDPVMRPEEVAPGVVRWSPPVREFTLTRVTLDERVRRADLPAPGARVLLCLSGEVAVEAGPAGTAGNVGTAGTVLTPGRAAFAPATVPAVTLAGRGEVFQATAAG